MIAAALLPLSGAGPTAGRVSPARPTRIVSMNECTDLLVLQLVSKARIRSISFLAHEGVAAIAPGLDAGVAVNKGATEDVVMQRPDLILAGDYTTPVAKRLAERTGVPVVVVKSVSGFADIRDVVRQVARAVGEPTRGEALVAEMDRKLAWLRAHPPARRHTVAAWSGGSVPGRTTLANDIIEAAGAVNVATKLDSANYSSFGVEELLRARPDVLIEADNAEKDLSLHELGSENPLVRRIWRGRIISYPAALFACGVPQSADAALRLRAALDRLGALPHGGRP